MRGKFNGKKKGGAVESTNKPKEAPPTPIISDAEPGPPWYESNLFWGGLAISVAVVLTVVGRKYFPSIVFLAWLPAMVAVWRATSVLKPQTRRVGARFLGAVVLAFGLWALYKWLPPAGESAQSSPIPRPLVPLATPNSPPLQVLTKPHESPAPPPPNQPTFKEALGDFVALVGGTQYSVSQLSTKQKPTRIIAFGDTPAITAYVEHDKLYVDTLLYYAPDKPPLQLVHNQLNGTPPQWDRNFDDSAVEIVDEKLTPRFQLVYKNTRTVVLRGVFQFRDGAAVFGDHANYFIGSREKEVNIARIFKYPSRLHQGEELADVTH